MEQIDVQLNVSETIPVMNMIKDKAQIHREPHFKLMALSLWNKYRTLTAKVWFQSSVVKIC